MRADEHFLPDRRGLQPVRWALPRHHAVPPLLMRASSESERSGELCKIRHSMSPCVIHFEAVDHTVALHIHTTAQRAALRMAAKNDGDTQRQSQPRRIRSRSGRVYPRRVAVPRKPCKSFGAELGIAWISTFCNCVSSTAACRGRQAPRCFGRWSSTWTRCDRIGRPQQRRCDNN